MRTTIDLPANLLTNAMHAAGVKTKTSAIILGLKELLRQEHIRHIRDLRGKVDIDVNTKISRRKEFDPTIGLS